MAVTRTLVLAIVAAIVCPRTAAAEVDYLSQLKPILSARCYSCHSALRKQSGLRVDTAVFLIAGGDSGAAVAPGSAADSLLIDMLTGELGIRMPPEGEGETLDAEQIELFKQWIDEGAKAPAEAPPPDPRDHWAYKPPERSAAPDVENDQWIRNPIDAFIAAGHESAGLMAVAETEKPTLLRRVYFDLIGLPPTPEEMRAFVADDSPDAYERVVDRLLASSQYGERWGRHWMDVWRYSDWSGYMEEIRNSARHIWRWRDWIVESLNADKGYDRMVVEMLAGDEASPGDPDAQRATGFLARNWFKFNRNTWLDSTVEHTSKALLGVTMNCARCHDHKYDPISQINYFQMRAIFEPHDVRTDRVPGQPDVLKDGLPRVCDVKPDEPTYLFLRGNETEPETDEPIAPGVPQVLGGNFAVDPVILPVAAYYPALRDFVVKEDLTAAEKTVFDREAARTAVQAQVAAAKKSFDDLAAAGGDTAVLRQELETSMRAAEVADNQLATARATHASLKARIAAEKAKHGVASGAQAAALASTASKAEREMVLCEARQQCDAAKNELNQVKAALKPDDAATAAAVTAAEAKLATTKTALAAAHAALATESSTYQPLGEVLPATSTGRRLAFANWIVDRNNPLAARVAVNHIWLRHFGAPLVDNMFDFGLRSPQARNQPLLDWLAVEFMDHGWSMKHMHRLMVTSSAYRMNSGGDEVASANRALDPDNRLLWRMNPRRLEAEVIRDAMFYVAGRLDLAMGGPEIDHQLASQTPRRSLYFRHANEKRAKFIETFDGPSVNECYRRSESVVPQQALALANSDVSFVQARNVAGRLAQQSASGPVSDADFVMFAFQRVLGREPTVTEAAECAAFLAEQTARLASPQKLTLLAGGGKAAVEASADPQDRARESLVHVLYNHNDFVTVR